MKKTIAMLLGMAMLFSVAACGNKKNGETEAPSEAETPAETPAEGTADSSYVSAFDFEEVSEYVVLGEYKNIEVTAIDTTVTEEDVEEELQAQVKYSGPYYEEIKEGTVAEGDVANIDFVGKIDGVAFDGGTASGFNLAIGSGQFIDGFEAGLIGAAIGDTVVLDLNFPDPYSVNPDLAGKPVEFTVTINYVQGEEIEVELDDAFVEKLTSGTYKTVEEYRAYVRSEMENSAKAEAKQAQINEAWSKVVENSTLKKLPEELVNYVYDSQMKQLEETVSMYDMTVEDYAEMLGDTMENMEAQLLAYAESEAQTQLLIRAIIETEDMDLTEEEYNAGLEELAAEMGTSGEILKLYYSEDMLKDIIRYERVQEFLIEHVVFAEAE